MSLGTVLVPAYDPQVLRSALRTAGPLCERTGAKLVGLHVRERFPAAQVAEYYAHTPVLAEFEKGIAQRADELRTVFEEEAKGLSETEWLQREGAESVDLGVAARLADVIVLGDPSAAKRADRTDMAESVLIGSGKPCIFAGAAPFRGEHILVGWNGSAEASRAIAVARPLLEQAGHVTVLSVGPPADRAPSAEQVAETLVRGGIDAEGRQVEHPGQKVSAVFEREAQASGADSFLIGAYSHSRLRERIMGGVTRKLITNVAFPTIMVH